MSEGPVLRMEFDGAELPLVRSLVEEAALRARLATAVKGALVQAVSEIATNAVVHGGGAGAVELRVVAGELRCEVTDSGPGPAARRPEGHGLRLAESLFADVGTTGRIAVHSTPRGTTATLFVPLPARVTAPPAR
ncbi:ATP-binding protein [Streptomyces europaeiscabiei]|uniref:ATP-binding protein n=1 Tax=Streptomyces europaeiscabiei TaxID=146819 RepID=UPI0006285943|nr:ATP-binding protein [Streptomyces europaeiscabiei]MDX3666540.1 ATP-binding protein [Streptomyces europaeiscabiei]MDX3711478.1 ATP-binding protein [Streptomyces europaeiscabiei]MDX3779345.1 ATP-binding protein [Streptomyces europaeiscabiei]MDX3840601.1 ATP-binding protein [Streptomyces europaeiscabiei]MDX3864637.1 ATP-binding protein [Streptomyces europaeiscabiei]